MIFKLCISIIIPIFAGLAMLIPFFRKNDTPFPLILSLAFGLGMGLTSQVMLLLDFAGINFSILSITSVLFLLSIPMALKKTQLYFSSTQPPEENTEKKQSPGGISSLNHPEKALIAAGCIYIIYITLYVFWNSLQVPISYWDAMMYIAYKAKLIFFDRSLSFLGNTPHPSYPVQVSLMESWTALAIGSWHEIYVKFIFPVCFLCFNTTVYYFLRAYTGIKWAVLGVIFTLSSAFFVFHATIAYTDFFCMYYTSTAIMLFIHWYSLKRTNLLVLASLFMGFSTFTKTEGSIYLVILTILFLGIFILERKKLLNKLKILTGFFIPAYSIFFGFMLYKLVKGIPLTERNTFAFGPESLSRISHILESFNKELFFSYNWNIIWFFLIITLITNHKKVIKVMEIRLLLCTVTLFLMSWFLLGIFGENYTYIAGELSSQVRSRLFLHFYPLAPLLLTLLNAPLRVATPRS